MVMFWVTSFLSVWFSFLYSSFFYFWQDFTIKMISVESIWEELVSKEWWKGVSHSHWKRHDEIFQELLKIFHDQSW